MIKTRLTPFLGLQFSFNETDYRILKNKIKTQNFRKPLASLRKYKLWSQHSKLRAWLSLAISSWEILSLTFCGLTASASSAIEFWEKRKLENRENIYFPLYESVWCGHLVGQKSTLDWKIIWSIDSLPKYLTCILENR